LNESRQRESEVAVLGRQGEEEWRRLRRQLDYADEFWLGFLFTSSPPVADLFRRRIDAVLQRRVRSLRRLCADDAPERLPALLERLQSDEVAGAGVVWVESLRVDADGERKPWLQAWNRLLLRLNERRESLRRHLPGTGLVLVAPPAVKRWVREAAPDLWSIRAVVLEPQPARPRADEIPASRDHSATENTLPPDDRPTVAERGAPPDNLAPVSSDREIARRLRQAEGLLLQERAEEAAVAALDATTRLRGRPESRLRLSDALWLLARAERASGDPAAAEEHVAQALDLLRGQETRGHLEWSDALGRLLRARERPAEALGVYERMTGVARRLLSEYGESPERLRDVSVSLDRVGDVRRELGDLTGAGESYAESLEVSRRLLSEYGESPERLRDVSVSLNKVGDVRRELGDLTGAGESYAESLEVRRRLLSEYGESPERLRDVSVSLERVGLLSRDEGDEASAQGHLREALGLAESVVDQYGETPARAADVAHLARLTARPEETPKSG